MKDEQSELIIKYLQGQLDTQGMNDFYAWVNENTENKKVFFEIKAIYDACYFNGMQNDPKESWDRLQKKRKVLYPRKKSRWLQLGNYAAVSFITVCLTSLFLTLNKDEDKIATRYIGGDGLDADVVELPDGTHVCLGSKTVFHYENDYGRKQRTVYLEGEAYFEVKKNEAKPFIVKTDEFNVRVLGTSFNISAYSDFPLAHTTLCSGHVRLSDRMNPGKEVDILPGEQLLFHRDSREMNVQEVDVDVFVSWRDGSFQFDNNTVEEVFTILQRWYNIQVFYANVEVRQELFTGKLPRFDNLQIIIDLIERVSDLKIEVRGKMIYIDK